MKKPNPAFAIILAALIGVLGLALPAQAQWRDPAANGTAHITGGTITGVTLSATSITDSGLTSGRIPYASTGGLLVDSAMLTTTTANGLDALSIGTGSTTNAGLIIGYRSSGFGGIWPTKAGTPSTTNYALIADGTDSYLNSSSSVGLRIANSTVLSALSTGVGVTGTLSATGKIYSSASGFVAGSAYGSVTPSDGYLHLSGNANLGYNTDQGYRLAVNGAIKVVDSVRITANGTTGYHLGTNSDVNISRLGAASIAIGNGTAGDTSGYITANRFVSSISSNGYIGWSAGVLYLNPTSGGETQFAVGGTKYSAIASTAFYPQTAGTFDLGAAGTKGFKRIYFDYTNTAPGTTGNQTINKATGRVNLAAAATAITVTNSLVTANSNIMATAQTNDATCSVKNVVPASGSFVINMTAACTAETAVAFFVVSTD